MLYYSGDFDLKGLQIAAYLMARYPGRCHPWRFDPKSYLFALQSRQEDGPATGHPRASELAMLSTLPHDFRSTGCKDARGKSLGVSRGYFAFTGGGCFRGREGWVNDGCWALLASI